MFLEPDPNQFVLPPGWREHSGGGLCIQLLCQNYLLTNSLAPPRPRLGKRIIRSVDLILTWCGWYLTAGFHTIDVTSYIINDSTVNIVVLHFHPGINTGLSYLSTFSKIRYRCIFFFLEGFSYLNQKVCRFSTLISRVGRSSSFNQELVGFVVCCLNHEV